MAYSSDFDLQQIRPGILGYGVDSWATQRRIAEDQINRILDTTWYRDAAASRGLDVREHPFDATKVDADQLKYLSCYKTLALAYLHLMKDGVEDGFKLQHDLFSKMYEQEMSSVLAAGVSYDFDNDGNIESTEVGTRPVRRLVRG